MYDNFDISLDIINLYYDTICISLFIPWYRWMDSILIIISLFCQNCLQKKKAYEQHYFMQVNALTKYLIY